MKQLGEERNELRAQIQKRKAEDELPAAKKSKSTTAATSTASPSASAKPATPPFDVVTDSLPSREVALQLLEGFESTSETSVLMKWELFGNDNIVNWLGMKEPYIHPVKFDGWVICFAGTTTRIHAWAAFQRANIKY